MKILNVFLLCLINTFVWASSVPITGEARPGTEKLDKSIIQLLKSWHIPGAAVAVVQNGKLIYSRGYGYSDLSTQEPVQPDALFRIASVSKAITAVTTLKLIEEGKLHFDDRVFDILNDLRPLNDRSIHPSVYKITVRDLLHMSTGWIPRGGAHYDPLFGPWNKRFVNAVGKAHLPASCLDTTRMMLSVPLRSSPGRQFAYSNLDYCILGLVINKVTGHEYGFKGYETVVNEEIFHPLGIYDMSIGFTDTSRRKMNEVHYYDFSRPDRGRPIPENSDRYQYSVSYLPYSEYQILNKNFANGGWVASAPSLAKFVAAVWNGQVISNSSLQTMIARPSYVRNRDKLYFGMGWRVKQVGRDKIWFQTGSFTGTNAFVMHKSNGVSIAIIFNARPPAYQLFHSFRPRLQNVLYSSRNYDLMAGFEE